MRSPAPGRWPFRALIPLLLLGWAGIIAPAVSAQETPPTESAPPAPPAPPPPPEIVPMDFFHVAEDLEVTLWARTPLLRNPTNMDIDARGRIWIAEGVNYRRHEGRDPAGDRIMVLEDTDGDGQADKSWAFVQEPLLVAPLGVAVIDNQIVVSNAPDLIVYTDVDRDARFNPAVDKREVLLTGFNGRNHDHALHSVTVGPDGRWYFNQGNAGAMVTDRSGRTFRFGSIYDPVRSGGATPIYGWRPSDFAGARSDDGHVYVGGAAMRMQPDGTNVEVIGFNFRNSYEQAVTSFGDVFQNDNDDPPACRTTFLIEYGNLGFFSRDGRRSWSADRRPGQPTAVAEWRQDDPGHIPAGDVYGGGSPTGIVNYEGDALGERWRGVLLSCEPARNTVLGYFPQPDGAGYRLDRFDFLTTNRERQFQGTDFRGGSRSITGELKTYFRPADIAVGPDGAIYVADWFDPRVGGHQDLDTTTSGAIYRIAPKGFKSVVPPLDLATTEGQIAALKNPATNVRALGFTRLRAQGAKALPAVTALLRDRNPYVRARAIGLIGQLGADGLATLEDLLRVEDPMTRLAAFRALRRENHRVLDSAHTLASDVSPAVRREVAVAMRDMPLTAARDILVALARGYDGLDRAYLEAWGIGCTSKENEIAAALRQAMTPPDDPLQWSAAYTGLMWRLTPPATALDFAARAQAPALAEKERLAAVTALAYMPTRDAAFALLELAQNGAGMVKTHALWWLINYRNTRWRDFGVEVALKERGLYDADNVVITESLVPPPPETSALPPVAEILALTGDAKSGESLATTCLLCHRIGERGNDYGPALTGWANRQTTETAVMAIVNPSAEIAHGYNGAEVVTRDGVTIHGLVLTNSDPLVVQSTGGAMQLIPAAKVQSRRLLGRSLMLNADQLGLNAQNVADIVAYLKTQ